MRQEETKGTKGAKGQINKDNAPLTTKENIILETITKEE